jgi:hypothetical protein
VEQLKQLASVDATSGYYIQAFALCRTAFEDWGVLEYLDEHPEDATLWLKGITAEGADFNTMTFAKIWPVVEQRVASAGKLYGDLCSMSHPTGASLRWTFDADADTWSLRVGSTYNREDAVSTLTYLLSVALQLYTPVERLHIKMLGGLRSEWRANARPIIGDACAVLGVRSPWELGQP